MDAFQAMRVAVVIQLAVTTSMATVAATHAVISVCPKSVTSSQENVTSSVCPGMMGKDATDNAHTLSMGIDACTYAVNTVSTGCAIQYMVFAKRAANQDTGDHFVHLSVLHVHMGQSAQMNAVVTVTTNHVTL